MVKCSSANIIAWRHASHRSLDRSYPMIVVSSFAFLVLSTFRSLPKDGCCGISMDLQKNTCYYRDEASDCCLHAFATPCLVAILLFVISIATVFFKTLSSHTSEPHQLLGISRYYISPGLVLLIQPQILLSHFPPNIPP